MEFGLTQLWSDGWFGAIARGALTTVLVSLAAMALGLIIGTLCGLTKWVRVPVLHWLVDGYTSVIRGVPELLIIYLLFFSSVELVTKIASAFGFAGFAQAGYAFVIAVIAIGAISGAYSTEVVRGALASIPKGHLEAARALGLQRGRIFRRIIFPQMLRIAVPGLNNIWQTTIKDTALVSVVGLQELMRTSYIGANSTHHPFVFYVIAASVYLLITLTTQVGFDRIEHLLQFRKKA